MDNESNASVSDAHIGSINTIWAAALSPGNVNCLTVNHETGAANPSLSGITELRNEIESY
jgi:hypothetical protein